MGMPVSSGGVPGPPLPPAPKVEEPVKSALKAVQNEAPPSASTHAGKPADSFEQSGADLGARFGAGLANLAGLQQSDPAQPSAGQVLRSLESIGANGPEALHAAPAGAEGTRRLMVGEVARASASTASASSLAQTARPSDSGRFESIFSGQVARQILEEQLRKGGPDLGPVRKADEQEKPPDNQSIGIGTQPAGASGSVITASDKFPGAGGSWSAQQPSESSPTLPQSTDPLARRSGHADDGKKVGQDYFKSDAQKLVDLADPKAPMKDPELGGGDVDGRNPLGIKSGTELLGDTPTTIGAGEGRNTSSRRDQMSDEPGTVTLTSKSPDGVTTTEKRYPDGEKTYTTEDPKDGSMVYKRVDRDGGTHVTVWVPDGSSGQRVTERFVETKRDGSQMIQTRNPDGSYTTKRTDPMGYPTKKTPNPETDTGDEHNPKGGVLGEMQETPKSPDEMEAEDRRQVSLPSEGQSQPQRVHLSSEDTWAMAKGKMTGGRIDPDDRNPDSGGNGTHGGTPGQGFGPERVDHFGAGVGLSHPQGAPPRGGNTPDNPTAEQSTSTSDVPNTSTGRDEGTTTGETSNRP